MTYFTADLHIGHANIIRHCDRPFQTADEMDAALLQNWNARVHRNDTIYILGDLFFRNTTPAEEYLSQMKGKKHLVVGNHDKDWMKKTDMQKYFESVDALAEIHVDGHRMTLCHYPMMSWNQCDHGAFLIYGHIHNNTKDPYWPLLREMDHAFNAGVDVNGFVPVTLEELIENNRRFKEAN